MGACGSAAGGYDRQLLKCVREGDEFAAVDCLDRLRVVDCKKPVNDAGDTVLTLSISQTPRAAERIVKLANTVERANREGVTALHLCAQEGYAALATAIIKRATNPEFINATCMDGETPLIKAAKAQRWSLMKDLVDLKADVRIHDNVESMSTLLWIIAHSPSNVVRFLLEAKAEVNDANRWGQTTLHLAVSGTMRPNQYRNAGVMKLLSKRPDLATIDEMGLIKPDAGRIENRQENTKFATALGLQRLSSGNGAVVVKLLLDAKADPGVVNYDGYTPAMIAAFNGRHTMLELLLEQSEDALVNVTADKGQTALMMACLTGYPSIVELLLTREADITLRDNKGQNAMMKSVVAGHVKVFQSLLTHAQCTEAFLNTKDTESGSTVFHFACQADRSETFARVLLDTKLVDVDVANHSGHTPLHVAIASSSAAVQQGAATTGNLYHLVKQLISNKADLNAVDAVMLETPLMLAVQGGNAFMGTVLLLLKCKADLGLANKVGLTALELAVGASSTDDDARTDPVVQAIMGQLERDQDNEGEEDWNRDPDGLVMELDEISLLLESGMMDEDSTFATTPTASTSLSVTRLRSASSRGRRRVEDPVVPMSVLKPAIQMRKGGYNGYIEVKQQIQSPSAHTTAIRKAMPARPDTQDVAVWSEDDVGAWLDGCGLGFLRAKWKTQLVNGQVLLTLTDSESSLLNDASLGVTSPVHKLRLEQEINKLKAPKTSSRVQNNMELLRQSSDVAYAVLNADEIDLGAILGQGHYGRVYVATWRQSEVVVKISKEFLPGVVVGGVGEVDMRKAERALHEEAVMHRRVCNHPNVVSFIGCTLDPQKMWLVTQFEKRGTVERLLLNPAADENTPNVLEMKQHERRMLLTRLALGCAAGLAHLHKEHVIHRDIATRNLLLSIDFTVKVCDFGLSRLQRAADADDRGREGVDLKVTYTASVEGPVAWMAPESLKHRVYSKMSDVYMLGVCLYEIFSQQVPYADQGLELWEVASAVCAGKQLLARPADACSAVYALMQQCWALDPADRPTVEEVHRQLTLIYARQEAEISFRGGAGAVDDHSEPQAAQQSQYDDVIQIQGVAI